MEMAPESIIFCGKQGVKVVDIFLFESIEEKHLGASSETKRPRRGDATGQVDAKLGSFQEILPSQVGKANNRDGLQHKLLST